MKKHKLFFAIVWIAIGYGNLFAGDDPPAISPNFVPFDLDHWTLTAFDRATGEAVLQYSAEKPSFVPGQSVTTLANDTIGYFVRKIMEVREEGNTLHLQTADADMEDIFMNTSFTLVTSVKDLGGKDLRGLPTEELSQALTNEEGMIHPSAVILHSHNEKNQASATRIDLLNPALQRFKDDEVRINFLYLKENLDDTEIYSAANFDFVLEEAELFFSADAVLEFVFIGREIGDTVIKDGALERLRFYLEGRARAAAKLKATASAAFEIEGEQEILPDILRLTYTFPVGPVIVWVTFHVDILSEYLLLAEAEAVATWGFEANQVVRIGGEYVTATKHFEPIAEEEFSHELDPLVVEGEAKLEATLKIFPRVAMMVYSAAGPYADVIPYASANFHATAMVSSDGSSDLKWNANIDLGLDFRAGLKPAFFESLLGEVGPYETELFKWTLWETPAGLDLLSELGGNHVLPVNLPLSFRVTDSWGNRTPFMPVFFETAHGELDKPWAIADGSGVARVNWSLTAENADLNRETQIMTASLINTGDETVASLQAGVGINNRPTAFYVEELNETDSIVFRHMAFRDIEKVMFTMDQNQASLLVENTVFEDFDLGISGSFSSVYVVQNSRFSRGGTGLHIKGARRATELLVEDSHFEELSVLGIYFSFIPANLTGLTFTNCQNGIEGRVGGTADIRRSEFTDCQTGISLRLFDAVTLHELELSMSSPVDQHPPGRAVSIDYVFDQVNIKDLVINRYYTGLFGTQLKGGGVIEGVHTRDSKRGIELLDAHHLHIQSNSMFFDGEVGDDAAENDEYIGIILRRSHHNTVARNLIMGLCTGIREIACEHNRFTVNSVKDNKCATTGFRSIQSSPTVVNNTFNDNLGAAVLFEHPQWAWVSNNNFVSNQVGIAHSHGEAVVNAPGNYFSGQSEADVRGNVSADDPLEQAVSLVCDFPPDTLFIPSGGEALLGLHVKNHELPNDSVRVEFSDERGWLEGELAQSAEMTDTLGAVFYVNIVARGTIEDLLKGRTSQTIWGDVVSERSDDNARDSIVITIYNQELSRLSVLPGEQRLAPGDSLFFRAEAYDQYNLRMDADLRWTATGGHIHDNGWFYAPDVAENDLRITITATDPASSIFGEALVVVTDVQSRLQRISLVPAQASMRPGASLQFTANGTDQFGLSHSFEPEWTASGGSINRDGLFVAPYTKDTYAVMAESIFYGIAATAEVVVECFTHLNESVILCGADSVLINQIWVREAGIYNDTTWVNEGCDTVRIIEVFHFDLPEVALSWDPGLICIDRPPIQLTGGTPPGGDYTGPGVQNGWFDPEVAGLGLHSITYTYTDDNGCTNQATVLVEVDPCTGLVQRPGEDNWIRMYPNPATNQVFISVDLPAADQFSLRLLDVTGRILVTAGPFDATIEHPLDLQGLKPGYYLMKVVSGKRTAVKSLMIR